MKLTEDGGVSWTEIPTPAQQRQVQDCEIPHRGIKKARLLGGVMVVSQCGAAFVCRRDQAPEWRPLTADSRQLLDFEPHREGLAAVTDDREIIYFQPQLSSFEATGHHLQAVPVSISVAADRAVFLDETGKVWIANDDRIFSGRMFGQGRAHRWPIAARDRGLDQTFWGISKYFLYRSLDAGKRWERQTELPRAAAGLAIQPSGEVMVWGRHGYVARWSPEEGGLDPVAGLDGLDIVGIFRREDLWLVYGGMQYETTQRVEVARTFFPGQFAGSVPYGFVAGSADGGRSWTVLDRWEEGGVQAIFLGEDNRLTVLSWLGAVRRGRLQLTNAGQLSATMQTVLPANEETRGRVPYVERALVVDFLAGDTGWVLGWTHHLGHSLYRTSDGGKTWRPKKLAKRPVTELYRLRGGRWLALEPPRTLQLWERRRFRPFKSFPTNVEWVFVDAAGNLVVGLIDGTICSVEGENLQ